MTAHANARIEYDSPRGWWAADYFRIVCVCGWKSRWQDIDERRLGGPADKQLAEHIKEAAA